MELDPSVVGGVYQLVASHEYAWRVETHGDYATVDSMTGPTGFMDSFSGNGSSLSGPRRTSGTYTISQSNLFTAK